VEKTEEKNEKLTLFWSGEEISTEYLSKYYENELDNIKEENILLGEFDKNGKYSFSQEVKRGLVAIKKRVDEKNDNSYFLVAKTTKNSFTFKMKVFEIEEKELLGANLYIIEVVDDARFVKPLKTFVAQYVDKKNDEFINKAKYVFNINVEGEFNELEKQTNDAIAEAILPQAREKNKTYLDIAIEVLIEEILAELEFCGEDGKKIKEEFEKETAYTSSKEKVAKGELPKPNYRELKKKLDQIIEKNKGYEALVAVNPNFGKVFEKFNQAIENEKAQSKQTELMFEDFKKLDEKKEEKKEEKKADKGGAKSASKSSGGKSAGGGKSSGGGGGKKGGKKGGGGGGKKDKKKDKKKEPAWKGAVNTTLQPPIIKDAKPVVPTQREGNNEAKKLQRGRENSPQVKVPVPDERVIKDKTKKSTVTPAFLDDDDFSNDLDEYSKYIEEEKTKDKELDETLKLEAGKETEVKGVEKTVEEKEPVYDIEALEILLNLETQYKPPTDERTIR